MNQTTHQCPVDGCQVQVAFRLLMCSTHWKMVDRALTYKLVKAWRRGEGARSEAHQAACQAAIDNVNRKLRGDVP